MKVRRFCLILTGAALLAGCADHAATVAARPAMPATAPSTRPLDKADLSLDQIEPMPRLPATRPTSSAEHAPVEALVLYARARDAAAAGQRFTAIGLLEQAAKIDPDSYDIQYALAQAYSAPGGNGEKAIAADEAAARIEPDHLAVQAELGRHYLAQGDLSRALDHLLLAIQTDDYRNNEEAAAVVDFYLGKTLQKSGYDQAALDCFEKLLAALESGDLNPRSNPELAYLAQHPDALYVTTADLLSSRGQMDEAVHLYQIAADHQPEEFDYQARLVHALLRDGKRQAAVDRATSLVRSFRASPQSIALLKDAFGTTGGDDAVANDLRRLVHERPDDTSLLYALVDVLSSQGKTANATALLENAARQRHYETDLVRRLFKLYSDADDVDSAARTLIEALAARPESSRDLTSMWQELLRPWRKNHLTISRLEALKVAPSADASKQYWIAQMAVIWNRQQLSRSALEQAVRDVPPFAPAYRALINQYWLRDDWNEARKRSASQDLIDSVKRQGDAPLAAELSGVMLLDAKDPARASEQFAAARKLGANGTDLRLNQAAALSASGNFSRAQDVLWKLVQDRPTVEDAYLQLFRGYLEHRQPDQSIRVLQSWLAHDPASINAQILESTVLFQAGQVPAAERTLDNLFQQQPDNADVLAAMAAFYKQTNRPDDFISKLEAQRKAHPSNRAAVEQLVLMYADQKRTAEAVRVLDDSRAAAGRDPDLLYYLANLYSRIGQKSLTEQVLEQVVQIDPTHAPACNDLGYDWAEQGRNLARAESLIRTAVKMEPDNGSFLDSLGWVLYKRGKFAEAQSALKKAIEASSFPDPVVLDHLGDTLYRLNEKPQAAEQWKQSQLRLTALQREGDDEDRDDLKGLRLQLQQKLQQSKANEPASVAPVGGQHSQPTTNNQ